MPNGRVEDDEDQQRVEREDDWVPQAHAYTNACSRESISQPTRPTNSLCAQLPRDKLKSTARRKRSALASRLRPVPSNWQLLEATWECPKGGGRFRLFVIVLHCFGAWTPQVYPGPTPQEPTADRRKRAPQEVLRVGDPNAQERRDATQEEHRATGISNAHVQTQRRSNLLLPRPPPTEPKVVSENAKG